jgi:hypothetical protein
MSHPFLKRLCAGATLALVAAAAFVPSAQAGVSVIGGTQPKPIQVNDADAIKARWHNAGYDLRDPRARLPLGFKSHKGSISAVTHSATRTVPVAGTQASSSTFDRTPTVVVSLLLTGVAVVLLVGGTIARRRPATP